MHPTHASMNMSPPSTRHRACPTFSRRACLNSLDTWCLVVAVRLFSKRERFEVTSRFLHCRQSHPLRSVGDKHRVAHQPTTYAHMAATMPPIGGTVATVRSALLQSLRCLPRRIRIRAQSHTTQVSAHDGTHVRSTFAHQRVTITFPECVIARKTCCSNGWVFNSLHTNVNMVAHV